MFTSIQNTFSILNGPVGSIKKRVGHNSIDVYTYKCECECVLQAAKALLMATVKREKEVPDIVKMLLAHGVPPEFFEEVISVCLFVCMSVCMSVCVYYKIYQSTSQQDVWWNFGSLFTSQPASLHCRDFYYLRLTRMSVHVGSDTSAVCVHQWPK